MTTPPPTYSDAVQIERGSTLQRILDRSPSKEVQEDFDLDARNSFSSDSLLQVPQAMHNFNQDAPRKSRKHKEHREDSVSLEMKDTSNLVLLESMSFNMYGNPTATKLIDRIPEDGKGVVNLSLVFLTEKFPPDVAGDIWEFAYGSSESDNIDAITSMTDYLDMVFHFWLFRGTFLTIATRLCFLIMALLLWLAPQGDFKIIAPIISSIFACIVSAIVYYRVKIMLHYYKKGCGQYRLWEKYWGLKVRSFCQLRGFMTSSVNGTPFHPDNTTMFCGKRSKEVFQTITYTFPVFVTPFIHLALAWQLFASTLRATASDDYHTAEILPTAFLPALAILLHKPIWDQIKKGISNEKNYLNNLVFMWLIHCVCFLFTSISTAIFFIPTFLYSGAIFQLQLYYHLFEVLLYTLIVGIYMSISNNLSNIPFILMAIFGLLMLCDVINYYCFTSAKETQKHWENKHHDDENYV